MLSRWPSEIEGKKRMAKEVEYRKNVVTAGKKKTTTNNNGGHNNNRRSLSPFNDAPPLTTLTAPGVSREASFPSFTQAVFAAKDQAITCWCGGERASERGTRQGCVTPAKQDDHRLRLHVRQTEAPCFRRRKQQCWVMHLDTEVVSYMWWFVFVCINQA